MSRTYRFFIRNLETNQILEQSKDCTLRENQEPEIIFQLSKVLRGRAGDQIILLPQKNMGKFFEYHFEILTLQKKEISLKFKEKTVNQNELSFQLKLLLCLPNKPEKLEFILQKAVELGVSEITLVKGEFSQLKHQLRLDRLQKIMMEAAEQSERAYIPSLKIETNLLNYLQNQNSLWVAMERLNNTQNYFTLSELCENERKSRDKNISVVIGPEGGFSENEKRFILEKCFPCFSLGKRILRMETAAIVSLGIIGNDLA